MQGCRAFALVLGVTGFCRAADGTGVIALQGLDRTRGSKIGRVLHGALGRIPRCGICTQPDGPDNYGQSHAKDDEDIAAPVVPGTPPCCDAGPDGRSSLIEQPAASGTRGPCPPRQEVRRPEKWAKQLIVFLFPRIPNSPAAHRRIPPHSHNGRENRFILAFLGFSPIIATARNLRRPGGSQYSISGILAPQ